MATELTPIRTEADYEAALARGDHCDARIRLLEERRQSHTRCADPSDKVVHIERVRTQLADQQEFMQ